MFIPKDLTYVFLSVFLFSFSTPRLKVVFLTDFLYTYDVNIKFGIQNASWLCNTNFVQRKEGVCNAPLQDEQKKWCL